jgi:hypothetical protein
MQLNWVLSFMLAKWNEAPSVIFFEYHFFITSFLPRRMGLTVVHFALCVMFYTYVQLGGSISDMDKPISKNT